MRILVSWNPDRFGGTKALPQNIRPRTNPATGSVPVLRPCRFKAPVTRRSWRGLTAAARSSMMTRLKFGERAMQRVTITLDDDLMADLDRIIAARGYQHRSEAIRDLARSGLEQAAVEVAGSRNCVATLVYVYDHHAP